MKRKDITEAAKRVSEYKVDIKKYKKWVLHKPIAPKAKVYWAGFVDGKIALIDESWCYPDRYFLFTRRKDAKLYFDDVRKVEIREIK